MPLLKLNVLIVLLLTILFTSCGTSYIRYSDLHHTGSYQTSLKLISKQKRKVKYKTKGSTELNNSVYEYVECEKREETIENSSCLIFLENGKVIFFRGSYWVANDAPDSLIHRYTNPDINF